MESPYRRVPVGMYARVINYHCPCAHKKLATLGLCWCLAGDFLMSPLTSSCHSCHSQSVLGVGIETAAHFEGNHVLLGDSKVEFLTAVITHIPESQALQLCFSLSCPVTISPCKVGGCERTLALESWHFGLEVYPFFPGFIVGPVAQHWRLSEMA